MLNMLKNGIRCIIKDKKGQGMVEYALIIGLVAVGVIIVLGFLGDGIQAQFQAIIDALT